MGKDLVKDVTEGQEDAAKGKLVSMLNSKKEEVLALARKEVLSKVMQSGNL